MDQQKFPIYDLAFATVFAKDLTMSKVSDFANH